MHGIVLIEGLRERRLPDSLRQLVECEYKHFLGGSHGLVSIARLRLDERIAPTVGFALAMALEPHRYYARLNDTETMYVAYPQTVVRITRSDPDSIATAREIGRLFHVEADHMRYDEMFELDHPEMHDVVMSSPDGEAL